MKKSKPILFNTSMVQAILNGYKTQTRRVIKFKKEIQNPQVGFTTFSSNQKFAVRGIHKDGQFGESIFNLPYSIGNIMWVRETWQRVMSYKTNKLEYIYRTEYPDPSGYIDDWQGWKPSIFMPREACRLELKVTLVRIERLQDITDADAIKEGITDKVDPIGSFKALWYSINGKKSWNSNPWVFVYDFEIEIKK